MIALGNRCGVVHWVLEVGQRRGSGGTGGVVYCIMLVHQNRQMASEDTNLSACVNQTMHTPYRTPHMHHIQAIPRTIHTPYLNHTMNHTNAIPYATYTIFKPYRKPHKPFLNHIPNHMRAACISNHILLPDSNHSKCFIVGGGE